MAAKSVKYLLVYTYADYVSYVYTHNIDGMVDIFSNKPCDKLLTERWHIGKSFVHGVSDMPQCYDSAPQSAAVRVMIHLDVKILRQLSSKTRRC